jgi:hypothetical protein
MSSSPTVVTSEERDHGSRHSRALAADALVRSVDLGRVTEIVVPRPDACEHFGRIDVLVNNAAVVGWFALEVTEEVWDSITTPTKGAVLLRRQRPQSIGRGGGDREHLVEHRRSRRHQPQLRTQQRGSTRSRGSSRRTSSHRISSTHLRPGPTLGSELADEPHYDEVWGEVVPWAAPAARRWSGRSVSPPTSRRT